MRTIHEIYKSVGSAMRTHRIHMGISVRELCIKTVEEVANYRAIENGTRAVSLRKMIKLADGLNCDVVVTIVMREPQTQGWTNVSSVAKS